MRYLRKMLVLCVSTKNETDTDAEKDIDTDTENDIFDKDAEIPWAQRMRHLLKMRKTETLRHKTRHLRESLRLCVSMATKNKTVTDAEKDT